MKKILQSPATAYWLVMAALAGLCAIGLWRLGHAIFLILPGDPNEGWNAYHTAALLKAGTLYPPKEAYLVNNYPPLSFYVVGAASFLTGDVIIAGRLISLLSLGFIVVAMGAMLRRFGAGWPAAIFPGLFFTTGLLLFSDYAGMDDPQMLAHAVAMGALWVLIAAPRTTTRLALAAGLFVASLFVKHNIVALPAACGLWLLWKERDKGLVFAAFGLGFALLGLLAFRLVYGVSLLSVIATARLYSTAQLIEMAAAWAQWGGIPLLGLIALMVLQGRRSEVQLVALFAALSLTIGITFLGGAGVDVNAMFEADIALALAGGLLLGALPGLRVSAVAAVYVLPFLLFAGRNAEWQQANLNLSTLRAATAMAKADIAFMQAQKGPGACEMLSFCFWAGKPPAVDFFNIGQAFDTGARSDAELTARIQNGYYAVIQLDPDSDYALGENVHNAMAQRYRLHHDDWFGSFYVPK